MINCLIGSKWLTLHYTTRLLWRGQIGFGVVEQSIIPPWKTFVTNIQVIVMNSLWKFATVLLFDVLEVVFMLLGQVVCIDESEHDRRKCDVVSYLSPKF